MALKPIWMVGLVMMLVVAQGSEKKHAIVMEKAKFKELCPEGNFEELAKEIKDVSGLIVGKIGNVSFNDDFNIVVQMEAEKKLFEEFLEKEKTIKFPKIDGNDYKISAVIRCGDKNASNFSEFAKKGFNIDIRNDSCEYLGEGYGKMFGWMAAIVAFCVIYISGYFYFLYWSGDLGSKPSKWTDLEKFEFEGSRMLKFRGWVFPVYGFELAKILALSFFMVCAVFVYVCYRDMKDAMVVGALADAKIDQGLGNVLGNFCKVFVLPCAIFSGSMVVWMNKKIGFSKMLYTTVGIFAIYFAINAFVLWPMRSGLGIKPIIDYLIQFTDKSKGYSAFTTKMATGFFHIWAFPIPTMHFVMVELWGSIPISFFVWGFMAMSTKKEDAKRWYPTIAVVANLGQILAGFAMESFMGVKGVKFETKLMIVNALSALLTVLFAATYYFIDNVVMNFDRFQGSVTAKKAKKGVGMCKAMGSVFTDLHIATIVGLVFSYGVVMCFVELVFKDEMSAQLGWAGDKFSSMKGLESGLIGCATILAMLFLGSFMMLKCGWTITAMTTPILGIAIGSLFYIMCLSIKLYTPNEDWEFEKEMGTNSDGAKATMYVGLMLCVVMKSIKYALFDPTKEIAFLSLEKERRIVAKSVVDIVGARLGKAFGAFINIILSAQLSTKGGISLTQNYLWASFALFLTFMVLWLVCDIFLGRIIKRVDAESKDDEEVGAKIVELGALKEEERVTERLSEDEENDVQNLANEL